MILCICNYITIVTIYIYHYECMCLCMCIVWNNMEWHVDNIAFLPVEVSMNWAMGPNMSWIEPSSQPEMIPGFKGIRSQMACICMYHLNISQDLSLKPRTQDSGYPTHRNLPRTHFQLGIEAVRFHCALYGCRPRGLAPQYQKTAGKKRHCNLNKYWESMGKHGETTLFRLIILDPSGRLAGAKHRKDPAPSGSTHIA